jgi:hypothetical protein
LLLLGDVQHYDLCVSVLSALLELAQVLVASDLHPALLYVRTLDTHLAGLAELMIISEIPPNG